MALRVHTRIPSEAPRLMARSPRSSDPFGTSIQSAFLDRSRLPGPSGLAKPASSHSVASTDLVTLLRRTMHWTARTWNPLPPQVCEHLDQGVRSHSNFKLSAFPSGNNQAKLHERWSLHTFRLIYRPRTCASRFRTVITT